MFPFQFALLVPWYHTDEHRKLLVSVTRPKLHFLNACRIMTVLSLQWIVLKSYTEFNKSLKEDASLKHGVMHQSVNKQCQSTHLFAVPSPSKTAVSDMPSEKATEFWSHLTSTAVLTQLLRCKLCKPSNPTLFLKQSFEQTTFKKPNIHFQLSEPEKKHCSTQSSDWQQRKESSCGTGMNEWNCGSKAPFFSIKQAPEEP